MDQTEENKELEASEILQLSDSKRLELVTRVLKDYDQSDNQLQSWKEKKAEGLRILLGLLPEKKFPFEGCANLNVPLMRTIKETLHSSLVNSFDYEDPVEASPIGPEDVAKARKIDRFLDWQFTNEIPLFTLIDHLVDQSLTYGHIASKSRYVKEDREGETEFDGVKVDVPNVEDVLFPADSATDDVDEMEYIMHRIYMSKSDILKRMNSGTYEKSQLPENLMGERPYDSLDYERKRYLNLTTIFRDREPGLPMVLEWYGNFDINDDGIDEKLLVTVLKESKIILRCRKWRGSRPFTIHRISPLVNSPFGESVSDLLLRVNQELNTIHNQRVDAVTITNLPFGFIDPLIGLQGDIHLVPGKLIPVNGSPVNAVYFPNLQSIKPEMYREEELLFLYAERLFGAGANTQGITNPRRTSATEIMAVDKRVGIRFFVLFMRFRTSLSKLIKKVFELDQKHFPPKKQVRIMGVQDAPFMGKRGFPFEEFTAEQMQAKVDMVMRGKSIIDSQAEKQDKLSVYQLAMLNPLVQSDPLNIYNLTIDTLQALGVKNVDRYVKPPTTGVPKTPEEEHNLIAQGDKVDVNLMDDFNNHIAKHSGFINSEQFKLLPKEYQRKMVEHLAQSMRVKQTLDEMERIREKAMIEAGNRALGPMGMQPPMPPEAQGPQPEM